MDSGDVHEILKAEVNMSYTLFYEIINKLGRLRLIDVVLRRRGKERTKYVIKKYDANVVMTVLEH